MEDSLFTRVKNAWNVFRNRDPFYDYKERGTSFYYRPDRVKLNGNAEQTILNSVLNRIATDAASIDINHVRLDKNGRYLETIDSGLNYCLSVEANIDQTGRAFRQDLILTMLDKGTVAVVPVDTTDDPDETGSYTIESLRVGTITEWYPSHVKVKLYNERNGQKSEVVVSKRSVAIIENPFYAVMNAPNSTLQRLVRKLRILDAIDEQSGSGKLDLIIQLPYVINTERRRNQAEIRRKDIEQQLAGSRYGIAYTDGTEHITQLNRAVENTLTSQIEYQTRMLYSQLGITQGILDGSADEKTMLNYDNRIVEPILATITDEFKRKFLTKTARTKRQSIFFFRDPFRLVPIDKLAEIADKFTRNEILSSNEVRQIIGRKPSKDPRADQLRNKNLNEPGSAKENQSNSQIQSEEEETNGEDV